MFGVIFAVMRKELIQTFRDKRMLPLLFVAPVIQTTLFGFAVNLDLVAQPVVVSDRDLSRASRHVVEVIGESDSFRLVGFTASDDEAEEAILTGRAAAAVFIPKGYSRDLETGEAEILVAMDGSDSNTAVRAGQEISGLLAHDAAVEMRERLTAAFAQKGCAAEALMPGVRIEPRAWFNPSLKTAIFLVPGVLALVLMVITMMLTSMGLTREKELGTLEQVMVSPLRSYELIIGKVLPFAVLGLIEVVLVVSLAVLVFDVPLRGSIPALFGAAAIFLMTTLGLGLFISTISETQQQAMMNALFIMLPALMLCGYIFPVEHMPPLAQWIAAVNPLTYFIEIARGIMVQGASVVDLAGSYAALTVIGGVVLGLASLRFKKRAS